MNILSIHSQYLISFIINYQFFDVLLYTILVYLRVLMGVFIKKYYINLIGLIIGKLSWL